VLILKPGSSRAWSCFLHAKLHGPNPAAHVAAPDAVQHRPEQACTAPRQLGDSDC
jgi:hypothetical protein